ncbi:zinc D-Ala-D-Ala carboxypeptidase [Hamadaea flava]|uniref:Peptidoglycan-binding protein n=1 Tax=Hamadaea flava TaxID=1742688 RepID=A0ABV8LMJ9_9ACTN|nr:M15 family metallopeptidase [Hamadaea flava]MCP2324018.1 zinc D-Ala-D-Ala carboxypeptidase [Hamadaea flava]
MSRRSLGALVALCVAMTTTAVALIAAPAQAACAYQWKNSSLSEGDTGPDVRELKIRLSGWTGYANTYYLDDIFGSELGDAVNRFKKEYGLPNDRIAGPAVLAKLDSLQSSDCSTDHFDWAEYKDGCSAPWDSAPLNDAAEAKANVRVLFWKLEALRRDLGDVPLIVTSGWRGSSSCWSFRESNHNYGLGIDIQGTKGANTSQLCTIAKAARYHGFNEILGPGKPSGDHETHVHLAWFRSKAAPYPSWEGWNAWNWNAPTCGVVRS